MVDRLSGGRSVESRPSTNKYASEGRKGGREGHSTRVTYITTDTYTARATRLTISLQLSILPERHQGGSRALHQDADSLRTSSR